MSFRFIFSFALALIFLLPGHTSACTSAIVSAQLNPAGRPLLWKHRDTSNTDNKVEYIPAADGSLAYVALFNANDKDLEQAWIGMNEAGFAIMNTESGNIRDDKLPKSMMDREGYVMTKALKSCVTVEDFAHLLDTLPRPMGVEANFGVIDATGNGAFFETNNHSFTRFNLSDSPDGILVRTNYSYSGRKNEGHGYIREANAFHLLAPYILDKAVTPEVLTEELSRTFYHDGKKKDFTHSMEKKVLDEDFIPRYKSTATVVIEGCQPIEDPESVDHEFFTDEYIMWTGLGYPPCSEIRPVRCTTSGVSDDLRGSMPNGHAPLSDKAKKMRDEVFTVNKKRYIDLSKLYNDQNSGYTQLLKQKNHQTYQSAR